MKLNGVTDPWHTHHINMKSGGNLTKAAQDAIDDTAKKLADFGIDPYFGNENLAFVPNRWGHNSEYALEVNKAISKVVTDGGSKADAVKALDRMTKRWLDQEFRNVPASQKKPWKILPEKMRR